MRPSVRPHGISSDTFSVYSPDLHIKIYGCLSDFSVCGHLILLIRLNIRFLFVKPRFRYCFFSPISHDINLASRYRVRRQLRPLGLSPKPRNMPVIPQKEHHRSDAPKQASYNGFQKHNCVKSAISLLAFYCSLSRFKCFTRKSDAGLLSQTTNLSKITNMKTTDFIRFPGYHPILVISAYVNLSLLKLDSAIKSKFYPTTIIQ